MKTPSAKPATLSSTSSIAIVGMSCVYPDANSPQELFENVITQRRAFRRFPATRLRRDDYLSTDKSDPDKTYMLQGAFIEGYEFDRQRFRVPGSTYRTADLTHWLALDVASRALEDAGFPEAKGLPRDTTGVLLGNTLTGEFSRANIMRLRWPYVQRVVRSLLDQDDWDSDRKNKFLAELEGRYKHPFPEVADETLAGGLANTIAGRICNHFDLHGGGYTVDGACASSLLSIANSASALVAGDLDVAIAGGVDLSLDPFEIIGFARLGALAAQKMRIYDRASEGFWPGEGCGVVVLMRLADALATQRRIYAVIQGWGISSDGGGGLTRPEQAGQVMALRRAYKRAGYGADSVGLFEGHGTGTAVGDPTELAVITQAIREASTADRVHDRVAIGSVKANIGHTKAAAGVAGFIKATLAVHHQILPPTTGCDHPHESFDDASSSLRVLRGAERWPASQPRRASVSAMGFGGINAHVTLEGVPAPELDRDAPGAIRLQGLVNKSRVRDHSELFCWSAESIEQLQQQIQNVVRYAADVSLAELTDLAAQLAARCLADEKPSTQKTSDTNGSKAHAIRRHRAALVAASPEELTARLTTLLGWIEKRVEQRFDLSLGVFLGSASAGECRVGLLFPGQASPSYFQGGALADRFDSINELYSRLQFDPTADPRKTEVAQPAICAAERAGLLALEECGLSADVAIGHSVGELAALHWAGAFEEKTLLRLAGERGKLMGQHGQKNGAMAALATTKATTTELLGDLPAVIAGLNAQGQTIISGDADAVDRVVETAMSRGIGAKELKVSHAFHSFHMDPVVEPFRQALALEKFESTTRTVISTISGSVIQPNTDLKSLLVRQLTSPVLFAGTFEEAQQDVDLWIECGPGAVLSSMVSESSKAPVIALDASGASIQGLLLACGAALVKGHSVAIHKLFDNRFVRDFDLEGSPSFFENPCEQAPSVESLSHKQTIKSGSGSPGSEEPSDAELGNMDPLDVVREVVAHHLELPVETVTAQSHLLSELHLNSITIGQLVGRAARRLGISSPRALTEFANATVMEIAQALTELQGSPEVAAEKIPSGVDTWVRCFVTDWKLQPLPEAPVPTGSRTMTNGHSTSKAASSNGHARRWKVVNHTEHPLASGLATALEAHTTGTGVVVCLPLKVEQCCIQDLLTSAKQVLKNRQAQRYVVVQDTQNGGPSAAGFAKTLHLEAPNVEVCVIDLPVAHSKAVDWIAQETAQLRGFREVRYDQEGHRWTPEMRVLPNHSPASVKNRLGAEDVVLVTGGGKGIAAECAMQLAGDMGSQLILLGRSDPKTDPELASNLERFQKMGLRFAYYSADVTDETAVQKVLVTAQQKVGSVTAVIHGSGINVPTLIPSLDVAGFRNTFAPKVIGLRNLLTVLDPRKIRLLATFSSIIGRIGLPGEADYAHSNDILSLLTQRYKQMNPQCHCVALEWSVWSGVGMGQRLGRLEALENQGITPISTDQGMKMFTELVNRDLPQTSIVVSGRFGNPPTVRWRPAKTSLLRYIENVRVDYPGVELIVDVDLSCDHDPYLLDHKVQGQPLFPAVMGLEAMAQAVKKLHPEMTSVTFEDVQFNRPIVVSQHEKQTLRVAILEQSPQLEQSPRSFQVALRCAETRFQVDHFRATCLASQESVHPNSTHDISEIMNQEIPMDPLDDLYNSGILFHKGRFRRLKSYGQLSATSCSAEFSTAASNHWFASFLPGELVLGDASLRDAAIHAIQACIPHARILPLGVERIVTGHLTQATAHRVVAQERYRQGDLFVYDMEIRSINGDVVERWEGLRLQKVEPLPEFQHWPLAMLAPYFERRLQEIVVGQPHRVGFVHNPTRQRGRASALVSQAAGRNIRVSYRPDGKPQLDNGDSLSISHMEDFATTLMGPGKIGCDSERITHRERRDWQNLLGEERLALADQIVEENDSSLDEAATRVWTALESLKKSGTPLDVPLTFDRAEDTGWIIFKAGPLNISTWVGSLAKNPYSFCCTFLTESSYANI